VSNVLLGDFFLGTLADSYRVINRDDASFFAVSTTTRESTHSRVTTCVDGEQFIFDSDLSIIGSLFKVPVLVCAIKCSRHLPVFLQSTTRYVIGRPLRADDLRAPLKSIDLFDRHELFVPSERQKKSTVSLLELVPFTNKMK
jgi:hypothetical protein